jgi:undecaprenyl-diphosphatase
MNIFDTVILGIVEGLTEFLPISSTGHLILASHLLHVEGPAVDTFEVFIQLGAILAVVFIYSRRFAMLFDFKTDPHIFAGFRGWKSLLITSLPAMVLGFLSHSYIKEHLFSPVTVLWALGLGGIAIIGVERLKLKGETLSLDQLTLKQALVVGLFQCLALWPGVSRAAATIIGGLVAGLDRKTAVQYSFIAAVPIMIMATLYDLMKSWHDILPGDLPYFALGFVVAFILAIFAIKFFIRLLQHWTLTPFGIYRIIIALLFWQVFH